MLKIKVCIVANCYLLIDFTLYLCKGIPTFVGDNYFSIYIIYVPMYNIHVYI